MLRDILRALGDLRSPAMWSVALKAVALTLTLLAGAFALAGWALGIGSDLSFTLPWIGEVGVGGGVTGALWALAALALSAFLMAPVAALFIGFLLDDVVDAVEARDYPALPRAPGVPILRQLGASLKLLGLMLVGNGAGLIMWLLAPPAAPFVFLGVNGWLIGREYFETVALRRMDAAAAKRLRRSHRLAAFGVGLGVALVMSVPLLGLIAPLLGVAAATHLYHRVA